MSGAAPPSTSHTDARPFGARLREAVAGPPAWLDGAPVTRALIWANVVVFAAEVGLARSAGALTSTPMRVMLTMGANYATGTVGDRRIETLLTSCFLHFSVLHIVFNMYALRQIGPPIERSVDTGRFAPMYLASGVVGSAASTAVGWFSGERISAGASGAICGIIGAALVLGLRAQGWRSPLAWAMGRWLGLLLVIQLVANVAGVEASFDNAAHFGGAFTGAAFAALWRRGPPYTPRARRIILAISGLSVVAAFGVVAWRDTHDPFVRLRASERYEVARALVHAGRCGEAEQAIRATERLVPGAPELIALEQDYEASCPKSELR